jgi:hypothetical protein
MQALELLRRGDSKMPAVLAEAVEKLNLKPGQTIREVVNGFTAELRLLDDQPMTETMICLAPEEQLAFWNALNEPVRLTKPQRQLGQLARDIP